MTAFLTGLALGVVGSAHCAGMCGPLVLTIAGGLGRSSTGARLQHALSYHGGRVIVYLVLGLSAGLLGETLSFLGLGRALAVLAGIVLLLAAAGSAAPDWLRRLGSGPAALATRTCATLGRWSRAHPVAGPVLSGAANGLLPCGLVYSAMLTAAALGSAASAVALMAGFGLGTVPALVALSLAAAAPAFGIRTRLRRLTPVLLAITAAILLARGLAPATTAHHVGQTALPATAHAHP
jgi:sulfite exporter TauE/SafE